MQPEMQQTAGTLGGLTFTTFLDLSTLHASWPTRWMIENVPPERWPFRGCKDMDGWFMYAHDENCGANQIPVDLWACCVLAQAADASWIRFDRDMDPWPGLQSYPERDDKIRLLWWVFEDEKEWAEWRDKYVPLGVQVLDINRELQPGRLNVTFAVEKAKTMELFGAEVGEDEWLED